MKNNNQSDLLPFEHGEEGTHSACKEMVDKLGGKVGCCICNGHKCKQPSDQHVKNMLRHVKFNMSEGVHCLNINCPERTGGKCIMFQHADILDMIKPDQPLCKCEIEKVRCLECADGWCDEHCRVERVEEKK